MAWSAAPSHVRVAARPPQTREDLSDMRTPVRVWWDRDGSGMSVQVAEGGAWIVLADDAQPGFETPRLARGTAIRVGRSDQGFSEPVYVPWAFSPAELSAFASTSGSLLGGTVGEISLDGDTVWAATLGGGLVQVEGQTLRQWTQYDGLPSDTVIAVSAQDGVILAGTGAGVARITHNAVERIWDSSLPDPWTQAVLVDGVNQWAGTLRGLVRLEPWMAMTEQPPSVYALSPDGEGGVWAGMNGLRHVPLDGPVGPVLALENDHVYDIVVDDDLWVASEDGGLHVGTAQGLVPHIDLGLSSTFSVAKSLGGWWAAGGSQGLWGPGGQVVGYADGLPGHAVWSLASAQDDNALWVGTDRGLAHFTPGPPLMQPIVRRMDVGRWPARSPVADLLPTKNGFWVADGRGVHRFGVPHRYAQNMEVAGPEQMRTILEDGRVLWAVGRWQIVRMDRRGRLRRAQSRVAIRDATLFRGDVWFISEYGLHRVRPGEMTPSLVVERAGFTRIVAGSRSMWAVADGIPMAVIGGTTRPFMRASAVLDLAPAGDVVCLGTADGLEVMFPDGDVIDVLGETDAREVVSAVAATESGACWFATATGTVGRTGTDDALRTRTLPLESDAEVHRLVPDGDWAWVLTNQGTWRVHIGAP